ncbi:MAG: imidazole glycerol phosphate synthase, glutamine amidotransferase subunit [Firmicutes bacterium ZCTH02-B6]|nr:MAG: imidazole glycerol phosphate synthase, glutamine amidotransferase subunit [Firmicutes bacterium ZCTH02-B6]
MIAIIDYGMGNLRSVEKALTYVGAEAVITQDPAVLERAAGVILPGVGAFAQAMANLRAAGLIDPIHQALASGKPFLGICLGLQLLFETSEERFDDGPELPRGLGALRGRVRRFPDGLKVPQIGWNTLRFPKETRLFAGIEPGSHVYFVHSYYAEPADSSVTAAVTEYGIEYCSAVEVDNVMAVQFHPEKSSRVGLQILSNFAALCR